MENINLSIIILSFRSKRDLEILLPSVWASRDISFNVGNLENSKYTGEVIVVDNGSNDGTWEWLEKEFKNTKFKIKIIKNSNTGFASGNNIGIRQATGRYILLLNPDTKVAPETFETMLGFMDKHPEVGISGCKLVKANGKLDLACRRRFPNPWNSFARLILRDNTNYNYSDIPEDQEMEVDSVVGAFMLIRRDALEKIGLLDEKFFMYGEDLDYAWRCKEAGYKVWYYPKTTVLHFKGESSKKVAFRALKWFHDAMWIFYQKHYSKRYPFIMNWSVFAAIYGRLAILTVINYFKAQPRVSA